MPQKPAILIIDLMHPGIIPMLEEVGFSVSYRPEILPSEVKPALPGYHGLIVRSKLEVNAALLEGAFNLKFIARAGAGVDNVDLQALEARNIKLLNAPEGNRQAVGEFTVGLLLSLFRKIPFADREVKNCQWQREENRGEEISGKTIGLIGYGHMGKAFARCLSGFGCTVLAYDHSEDATFDAYAHRVSLTELQQQADVVSLHIPYTPENFRFADTVFFERFGKNIWVLNTARGEVMDYAALVEKIKSGKVRGAALDVLENEKLKTLSPEQQENFSFLAHTNRVILTPHVAGWTHESYVKINEVLVRKIKETL